MESIYESRDVKLILISYCTYYESMLLQLVFDPESISIFCYISYCFYHSGTGINPRPTEQSLKCPTSHG